MRQSFRCRFQPLSKYSFKPIRCRLLNLGSDMRRREFITLLGGAAAVWPLAARAQQASDQRLIGVLSPISKTAAERNVEALRTGLRELGYIEGRNIRLEVRYADGAIERLPHLAAELVGFGPAVIVAGSSPAAIAARNATRTIPIIMNSSPDPVAIGLVAVLRDRAAMLPDSGGVIRL